jgi:hypothetical protein
VVGVAVDIQQPRVEGDGYRLHCAEVAPGRNVGNCK